MSFFSFLKKNNSKANKETVNTKSLPMENNSSKPDAVSVSAGAVDYSIGADVSAVSACVTGDFIHEQNVLSKAYLVPLSRFDAAMHDFLEQIYKSGNEIDGLPFFIIGDEIDGRVKTEIYVSVRSSNPVLPEGMRFYSYFSIDGMAALCIARDPEKNMAYAYECLGQFLEKNSMRAITPVFHVLGGDASKQYTFLKVGYIRKTNNG